MGRFKWQEKYVSLIDPSFMPKEAVVQYKCYLKSWIIEIWGNVLWTLWLSIEVMRPMYSPKGKYFLCRKWMFSTSTILDQDIQEGLEWRQKSLPPPFSMAAVHEDSDSRYESVWKFLFLEHEELLIRLNMHLHFGYKSYEPPQTRSNLCSISINLVPLVKSGIIVLWSIRERRVPMGRLEWQCWPQASSDGSQCLRSVAFTRSISNKWRHEGQNKVRGEPVTKLG